MTVKPEKSGNILVVDDKPENLHLLLKMLSDWGYNVWPAQSGARALAVLQKHPIDLILLDIMMPDMDGYAVCKRIKADERTSGIPVLFISALHETFDKLKAFSLGGVDYISKPFEDEEVFARIQAHLTIIRQKQELREQQERLQKLADTAFEGILIHENGIILEVNRALADMFGYEREKVIGRNALDLLVPESRDTALLHLNTESEHPYNVQAVKPDKTVFPVEIQAREIAWQGRPARVVAVRDVSWRTVLKHEQMSMKIELDDRDQFGALVGKTLIMKKVYESILRAAAADDPVVICGETGSGKELTARTVFDVSDHHKKAFVPVNCASIPDSLFESYFFGHRKGAFTGADQDHTGYFEQARDGVLFLDEVGELSLPMQAKLLRVLEEYIYTPVGAKDSISSDIRIIAASNKNLHALAKQGKMRTDFFHRLYVLTIDIPPLRLRKEDIPLLITHFMRQHADLKKQHTTLRSDLTERFFEYDWPGNVRELFNELRRYLATGEVRLSDALDDDITGEDNGLKLSEDLSLNDATEIFEQYYINKTLRRHGGHKGKTAENLNVDRKTLYRKLKKYGIE